MLWQEIIYQKFKIIYKISIVICWNNYWNSNNNEISKVRFFQKYQNFIWRDERIADQQQSDRIIKRKKENKLPSLGRSNYVIKRNTINPIHRHNKSGNKISGTRLEDTTRAGGSRGEGREEFRL